MLKVISMRETNLHRIKYHNKYLLVPFAQHLLFNLLFRNCFRKIIECEVEYFPIPHTRQYVPNPVTEVA